MLTISNYTNPASIYLIQEEINTNVCKGINVYSENLKDGYYIIKTNGPIKPEFKKFLQSKGIKIEGYIPNYAFLVKAKGEAIKMAYQENLIQWIDYYRASWKYPKGLPNFGKDTLLILLFEDAKTENVAQRLKEAGGEVLRIAENKWNKLIKIYINLSKINDIAAIEEIRWIELYRNPIFFNDKCQWVVQTWEDENRRVWKKGINGEGVIVSTSDSGIYTDHDMFRDPSIPIKDWGDYPNHRKIIAYKRGSDRATFGDAIQHGTHTGCTLCGDDEFVGGNAPFDGMSPKSRIYFVDIGAGDYWVYPPLDYNDLYILPYEGNEAGGARIMSNSWGMSDNGYYSIHSRQTDQFMWNHKDFLIFFASGNDDVKVGSPATAKNIVTVGATLNGKEAYLPAYFSNPGPTGDGRIKPTVVAPGILKSAAGSGYSSMSGTSMASPAAAGACGLIYQYFKEGWYPGGLPDPSESFIPSAALLKAMLVNSALSLPNYPSPSNKAGWGRVCVDSVLFIEDDLRKLTLWDDTIGINTGEEREFKVGVSNFEEPLKITLVWTDYPPEMSASKKLVNDLNLRVYSPKGVVYLGNQFKDGFSIPGGEPDNINPVENVWVQKPDPGNWTIKVKGSNVPFGPQPFALVITGALKKPLVPLTYAGYRIDDSEEGNNNGLLDPGEKATLYVKFLNNFDKKAFGVKGLLSSQDIIIIDSLSWYGNIPVGIVKEGEGFKIKAKHEAKKGDQVKLTVKIYEYGTEYVDTINFSFHISLGTKERADKSIKPKKKCFIAFDLIELLENLFKIDDIQEICVCDATGRMVYYSQLKRLQNYKSLNNLPEGVYFFRIKEKGNWYTIKVLKIKRG